ncbi:hypothetical protein GCM10027052_12820 [Parafrigoribacterium mesophilum]|uniref:META domain-containing protein n=1 Tax=Parafrigoribacterium mesophilum TaxID=433646 RepID=UPI0031FDC980
MKRLVGTIFAALMCVPLLAGCASARSGETPPGGEPPHNPAAPPVAGPGPGGVSPAIGLVNLWRVSGAEGEAADTWLRLDAQEFQLWRDCGMITGSWKASSGLFLAAAWGAMGDCATGSLPFVPWLEDVTGYAATAGGFKLSDSAGRVLASLTGDGAPQPIPAAAEFYTKPPRITPELQKALRTPSKLAAQLTPATVQTLLGTWVPVAYAVKTNPHVTFTDNGRWTGSDGCNGAQGRWVVGRDGELLTTSGPSTLIGCEGAPVPAWVAQATAAGFDRAGSDAARLLLFDRDGNEIGRLKRGSF